MGRLVQQMAREVEQDMRDEECLGAGRYPERYPSQQELVDQVEKLEDDVDELNRAMRQACQYFWAIKGMGRAFLGGGPPPRRWEDLHKGDREEISKCKPEFARWLQRNPADVTGEEA